MRGSDDVSEAGERAPCRYGRFDQSIFRAFAFGESKRALGKYMIELIFDNETAIILLLFGALIEFRHD
jgi:hypothetical protein